MAQQATSQQTAAGPEVHDAHHPSPAGYVRIAAILAVLTAMEVSLFYIEVGPAFIPAMIGLMSVKFTLVVAEFMHLKYDTKLYRRVMLLGLLTALGVYGIVLATFSSVRLEF
ncbi:MAG TPA: cytochrome C oxidase subunit IV family protein [Nitriliruptorales bacterium]